MGRFVLLLLLILAGAGLILCDDTSKTDQPVTITCPDPEHPKNCSAGPSSLSLKSWPKQLSIQSSEPGTWECQINDSASCTIPASSKVDSITLISTATGASVKLLVAGADDELSIDPRWSAVVAGVAFLVAGWVLYFAWKAANDGKQLASEVASTNAQLGDIDTNLQRIMEKLRLPPSPELPSFGQSQSSAYQQREISQLDPKVEGLRTEIREFVRYVNDCFAILRRNAPPEAGELEDLIPQIGGQASMQSATTFYKTRAWTLAQLSLSATDDAAKRQGQLNPRAETALQSLLQVAGLRLFVPRQYEPYSETLYDLAHTGSERTDDRNLRRSVARVERRGLIDSDNRVLLKPEVVIYD